MTAGTPSARSAAADRFACRIHGFEVAGSATGARVRAASRRFFRLFLDAGREAASETQLAITIAELDRGDAAQASGGPQSRVLVERELSPGVHFTVLEDDERVLALFRPGGSVRIEPKRRLARCETEPEALDRWP
ncbi:MAG: hypothetical protein ACE5O2_10180, partial [Armatimonadota bacterium]